MAAKDQNYDGVSQYFEHDYEEIRGKGNLELQSIASGLTQPAQKLPTQNEKEKKKKKQQTRCIPVLVTLLTVLVVAMAVVLVMLIFTGE